VSDTAATPAAATQPSVKLVVWDLDETLWDGILSEGPVCLSPRRAAQLRELVDRGVMVSISSRNDEATARAELERHGLWDLVIFPRINWEAKGAQIRDLIDAAQLRAPNVLFADDNHLNREEAVFFAPGIQAIDPADPGFDARIDAVSAAGKPDPDHRRLAEYRLLEAKAREAATFGDNAEFLRSCDIRVAITERPTDTARIADLIARTNQLNYRKEADQRGWACGRSSRTPRSRRSRSACPTGSATTVSSVRGRARRPCRAARVLVQDPGDGRRARGLRSARAAGD